MTETLLIELLTEELPPKSLQNLGQSFATAIANGLEKNQLINGETLYTTYATPRRLAVSVKNVKDIQPDISITRKGPSVANAIKDGNPTPALLGFARSCQVDIDKLSIINDGKQEVYAYEFTQHGQTLESLINEILDNAVKKLPIPKVMRWGSSTHTFVRPVHGLMVIHGKNLIKASTLGLQSRNKTLGHRFLSQGEIIINNADEYAETLKQQGFVISSFDERREFIKSQLNQYAEKLNTTVACDDSLLNEVTALVEYPVILQAQFEEHFLSVPQECLILTMQQNQKYFPLLDKNGKLTNHFLLVSNMKAENPQHIILGNEKVLRARLSDAEFFYKQDCKASLFSRLPKLENVVYHNKIGSQAERVERLIKISTAIAEKLSANIEQTRRAAQLAKADLLTEMVGEFPELQGVMGHYYALNDGEDKTVAQAIEQHYYPRFAGDSLPESDVGIAVALADKLETLIGIWGIGLKPTGDKDPYALRRAALGVMRMLMLKKLNLKEVLENVFNTFPDNKLSANTINEVSEFMMARLEIMLQSDFSHDEVASVLSVEKQNLNDIPNKLAAVASFKSLPEASALISANKRVRNILKKNPIDDGVVDKSLLQQAEELALYQATEEIAQSITPALSNKDFNAALTALASIKPTVDAFFEQVMVMAEDEKIRNNRLYLLQKLSMQMNAVADISLLINNSDDIASN